MSQTEKPKGLSFSAFKDWAFLGALGFLTTMLVNSIQDLNQNVKALTTEMGKRALEASVLSNEQQQLAASVKDHEDRLRELER